jgi:hypothetical protein
VQICTAEYCAPDVLLGSQHFEADLDMWSIGCVAAELSLREPLFQREGNELLERSLLDAHFAFLGAPPRNTSTHAWLKSLPFAEKFYGEDTEHMPAVAQTGWPPERLRGCPQQLGDFVRQTLQWHPQERLAAASASLHSFLSSRPLSVPVKMAVGKNGLGSIAEGALDDELLAYLQECPSWEQLHAECRRNPFKANGRMNERQAQASTKREFAGYIDANNPPKCRNLNGEVDLQLIISERLACFVKALRRGLKTWLHLLTRRVRVEIIRQRLPTADFVKSDASALFEDEDFADNAFVYASVQVLKVGAREDGWHTDGGTSLLHAAVTVFGSRTLLVQLEDGSCISLPQRPGSFYVGNLCALSHKVSHDEHAAGSLCAGPASEQVQIVVTLRSDVFRLATARKINASPEPAELFRIVNRETARHLAEEPFHLPDLAAVIAESREAGNASQ